MKKLTETKPEVPFGKTQMVAQNSTDVTLIFICCNDLQIVIDWAMGAPDHGFFSMD